MGESFEIFAPIHALHSRSKVGKLFRQYSQPLIFQYLAQFLQNKIPLLIQLQQTPHNVETPEVIAHNLILVYAWASYFYLSCFVQLDKIIKGISFLHRREISLENVLHIL